MATIKQKKAFQKVMNNDVSVSGAMVEVGYSPATANRPAVLTRSKGWGELLDEHMPDSVLAKRHRQLLNKNEKGTQEPDTFAVSKALEMAYKIKNKYPKEVGNENKIMIINISTEGSSKYNVKGNETDDSNK